MTKIRDGSSARTYSRQAFSLAPMKRNPAISGTCSFASLVRVVHQTPPTTSGTAIKATKRPMRDAGRGAGTFGEAGSATAAGDTAAAGAGFSVAAYHSKISRS